MLPRNSIAIFLAAAAGLLAIHLCILSGGTLRQAAVAFCAFALLIGAPIALLAWLGSLPDREHKRIARLSAAKVQQSEARLWQQMLTELQVATTPTRHYTILSGDPSHHDRTRHPLLSRVATAPPRATGKGERANRPILALWLVLASAAGLAGCETGTRDEGWMMVQPGIGTAQLVSLVGGPDYVRSNGTTEVWQYCRDRTFPIKWADEGRNARYYTAVLVDNDLVREVRPYAVQSRAGCKDFYRAEF
jgi:hypothetical protein